MGQAGHRSRWRDGGEPCQASEVLDGGGKEELVLRAGQSPEPEPLEAEIALQVRERHLAHRL
jgi:hypothetical protein